ncbi:unnamed protein product [Hydatigera taeniaeformis]|uniref:Uncharacterized protein n=1 Tax=Hydatigena taeniaeformis TaxID=6205 RepID=A0A0R3XCB6_HYDTA|nr:unnamed protein product [Hydatigera taeniaeformis]
MNEDADGNALVVPQLASSPSSRHTVESSPRALLDGGVESNHMVAHIARRGEGGGEVGWHEGKCSGDGVAVAE